MDTFQQKIMLQHIMKAERLDIVTIELYVKEFLAINPKMSTNDIIYLSTFTLKYKQQALRLRTFIFKHSKYKRDKYMTSFLKFMKAAKWTNSNKN